MTAAVLPRRALLAGVGGGLLFAAHPPADLAWAGAVALVPLLWLSRDVAASLRPLRAGLVWGLVAGLVFFGPLLWWIVRFGVVAWVLLVVLQAAFVAAFVAGLAAWGVRPGRGLAAVVWWVALEVARSSWPLSGLPWGILGYSQHGGGPLLPIARSFGVLGVSAVCAGLAVCVAEALQRGWAVLRAAPVAGRGAAAARAARAPALGAAGLLVASVLLARTPLPLPTGERLDAAAVQGNDLELPPVVDRTTSERIEQVTARMVTATARLADDPPDVTVWPENAIDADPRDNPELRRLLDETLALLDGAPLLAGTLLDGPRPGTFLNAIVEFRAGPVIHDLYVKRRLVPFGEYVPARRWLDWFPPLEQIPSDGVPGGEPGLFDIAGALIGPVTCFESVYPDLVHSQVRAGADVLVVSTNNASFGRTPASRQHLAFSQLRAVETGRWVLHAGISGISAVVDPHGRVSQRTELFEQTVVREELPLVAGLTLATRLGDAVGTGALVTAAAGLLWLSAERWLLVRAARRQVPSNRVPAARGSGPRHLAV